MEACFNNFLTSQPDLAEYGLVNGNKGRNTMCLADPT